MSSALLLGNLVDNIYLKGAVSQFVYLGPSFYFVQKRETNNHLLQFSFLDFIKEKTTGRPLIKSLRHGSLNGLQLRVFRITLS